jgi:hypothetical protein
MGLMHIVFYTHSPLQVYGLAPLLFYAIVAGALFGWYSIFIRLITWRERREIRAMLAERNTARSTARVDTPPATL